MADQLNGMKPMLSSLPLQVLIYCSWHYAAVFFFLNICLFTYKAVQYYYPSEFLGWDFVTVFMYILVEYTRLFLASKGNKTCNSRALAGSLILAMPILVLHAYYMELQTYVMRVDIALNAIAYCLLGIEILFQLLLLTSLSMSASYL